MTCLEYFNETTLRTPRYLPSLTYLALVLTTCRISFDVELKQQELRKPSSSSEVTSYTWSTSAASDQNVENGSTASKTLRQYCSWFHSMGMTSVCLRIPTRYVRSTLCDGAPLITCVFRTKCRTRWLFGIPFAIWSTLGLSILYVFFVFPVIVVHSADPRVKILFLNKNDLFTEKVKTSPIRRYFPVSMLET